jgi:adenine-specific DNA-methyltransferase
MPTLNWIGKEKIITHHHDVPFKVLNHLYTFNGNAPPDADISSNKIIHGDNLEALKALLPEYEGNIRCIYIDPPYNTGNENWVYNDNVSDPRLKKWLGQVVGRDSEDLSRHDKWLCMMYPRLVLLHKLLAKDGAIFISIDDNEQTSLKLICDELFGKENYLGNLIWRKKEGGGQTDKYFVTEHEYICAYQKSNSFCWLDTFRKKLDNEFNKFDEYGKFKLTKLEKWGSAARKEDRPTMHFPITDPNGIEYLPMAPDGNLGRWRVGKLTMENLITGSLIHWELKNNKYIPYEKTYQLENEETKIKERSIIYSLTNTADASKSLTEIFGRKDVFETPKPFALIEFLINHSTDPNSIILDSFAGSGTTAHAVLNLNKQDGGNRKFILIEMESYAEAITAERVKRVINGYTGKEGTGGSFDYYELGEPLFVGENGEYLNEAVSIEKIRSYIWYSETRCFLPAQQQSANMPLLGIHHHTAYYFIYHPMHLTSLDFETLAAINETAGQYIIYADNCLLSKEFLFRHNIVFKKIPRDISRF